MTVNIPTRRKCLNVRLRELIELRAKIVPAINFSLEEALGIYSKLEYVDVQIRYISLYPFKENIFTKKN